MIESGLKQQVRQFYDEVGWREIGEGIYQNARFEDLRPVSRDYIHRCHLRVVRHLSPTGRYFLDAGSGPIQYPEYLIYSQGYQARVCADISIVALQEARKRIGDRKDGGHGLFVVADIANLPFRAGTFDGVVSLHTIHHLPEEEHVQAYQELYRVLATARTAVVVNGWQRTSLISLFILPYRWMKKMRLQLRRIFGRAVQTGEPAGLRRGEAYKRERGTIVTKRNAAWLKREVGSKLPMEIYVWRSVSVSFLRAYIHEKTAGRWMLEKLYKLEERFPHFFGEHGQYPLIVIRKDRAGSNG